MTEGKQNVKEPHCPLDEHNFHGCLTFVDGRLTHYINRRCKANLLWLFWFNYAQSPYYEDPSLENGFYEKLTRRQDWVPYSKTIIIKEKDVIRRKKDSPNGYRQLDERIDFYVTKPEFAQAYEAIQQLGRQRGDKQVTEVVIFGLLHVVLLATAEFGRRMEIIPSTGSAGL